MWPEVAEISRNVLNLRYKYLPYLYTLFHDVRISLHFGFDELSICNLRMSLNVCSFTGVWKVTCGSLGIINNFFKQVK